MLTEKKTGVNKRHAYMNKRREDITKLHHLIEFRATRDCNWVRGHALRPANQHWNVSWTLVRVPVVDIRSRLKARWIETLWKLLQKATLLVSGNRSVYCWTGAKSFRAVKYKYNELKSQCPFSFKHRKRFEVSRRFLLEWALLEWSLKKSTFWLEASGGQQPHTFPVCLKANGF